MILLPIWGRTEDWRMHTHKKKIAMGVGGVRGTKD